MWTMCWVEDNYNGPVDKWDRFEFRSEVVAKLKELEKAGNVHMGDILIFPPIADDDTVTAESLLKKYGGEE